MEHHITREEIEAILSGRAFLIDVRSDNEVAEKKCPSALHWDVRQMIEGRFPNIPKELPVFVFSQESNRSSAAQRLLGSAGFTDAHDVGGLDNIPKELWQEAI